MITGHNWKKLNLEVVGGRWWQLRKWLLKIEVRQRNYMQQNFLVIAANMFECVYVFTLFPFSNNEKKTPLALLFFVFTRDTLQSFDLTMTYQRACIYSVYPPDLIADVTRVPFETP